MMSMNEQILQLYPTPGRESPLRGLYLEHDLRQFIRPGGRAYVYSNYILSLDSRIAIPQPDNSGMLVPDQITNSRDWRLFQELAVQADAVISSGRYLRDYADGQAQEILRVYDNPDLEDLKSWRESRGLAPYPDLIVISRSLAFPIPEALTQEDRSVLVFTDSEADPAKIEEMKARTSQVVIAGEEGVDGRTLVDCLTEMGYDMIYNATGPKVLHMLLAGDVLDRLYLTQTSRVLGGDPFSSIVEGDLLERPVDFHLNQLYYDPFALDGLGQLFSSYDRTTTPLE
jgi:riboflavin biosynthesis pyrimidine reductase